MHKEPYPVIREITEEERRKHCVNHDAVAVLSEPEMRKLKPYEFKTLELLMTESRYVILTDQGHREAPISNALCTMAAQALPWFYERIPDGLKYESPPEMQGGYDRLRRFILKNANIDPMS